MVLLIVLLVALTMTAPSHTVRVQSTDCTRRPSRAVNLDQIAAITKSRASTRMRVYHPQDAGFGESVSAHAAGPYQYATKPTGHPHQFGMLPRSSPTRWRGSDRSHSLACVHKGAGSNECPPQLKRHGRLRRVHVQSLFARPIR